MSHMDYMNVTAQRMFRSTHYRLAVGIQLAGDCRYADGDLARRIFARSLQALYRLLGSTDAIAGTQEEYIDLAVRFGTDEAFATEFNRRIAETAQSTLDRKHVDALYKHLVGQIRPGT